MHSENPHLSLEEAKILKNFQLWGRYKGNRQVFNNETNWYPEHELKTLQGYHYYPFVHLDAVVTYREWGRRPGSGRECLKETGYVEIKGSGNYKEEDCEEDEEIQIGILTDKGREVVDQNINNLASAMGREISWEQDVDPWRDYNGVVIRLEIKNRRV